MPRSQDPSRKRELLAQILDYLSDKPLSTLSFRELATALGVSTFTLVYQFGSRAELIRDIVRAIATRQRVAEVEALEAIDGNAGLEGHIHGIRASFEWALDPANHAMQRLEFEAAMLEALDPAAHTFTREVFAGWQDQVRLQLLGLGIGAEDAAREARLVNVVFYGFQYDLVVNDDPAGTRETFEVTIEAYRERITRLLEAAPPRGPA